MKRNSVFFYLNLSVVWLLLVTQHSFSAIVEPSINRYKTISATSCDSLIKANAENPDFVILDVRTPDVWKADHLMGSINRNYYDADFEVQLKALPKNKIFLLHCQSGGRSAPTLVKMKNLNFAEVYEMSGGINLWKSKSLPTTGILGPKLMLVSNGGIKNGTVNYGFSDTLKITITNRANDVLKFSSIILPVGNEFSSDFDLSRIVNGSEDYTFSVFYKPLLTFRESVIFSIAGNGGILTINIFLKQGTIQALQSLAQPEPEIYPNPASSYISFKNISETNLKEVSLLNTNGQLLKRNYDFLVSDLFNIAELSEGIYLIRFVSANQTFVKKIIINR